MLRRLFASSSETNSNTSNNNVGTLSNIKKRRGERNRKSTPLESLVRLFEPSLRSIAMRKEFRMVKDTAERALFKLRDVIKKKDEEITSNLLEELMRPFLLACNYNKETKSVPIVLESLSTIQRVMTTYKSILSVQSLRDVLRVLRIQSDRRHQDDHVRLKVLQSLPLLLSCDNFFLLSEKNDEDEDDVKMLKDVLTISFEFYNNSKSSLMIRNTSLATLRQLVTLLFENDTKIARACSRRFLNYLAVSLVKEKSVWIGKISKTLALELLHLILQRFHSVLKTEFPDLLNTVATGLVKNFKSVKSFGSNLVAPLIHVITTLLENCLTRVPEQSEILLSMMSKDLSLVSTTSIMLRRKGSFTTDDGEVTGIPTSDSAGFIESTATSISERLGLASSPRGRRSRRRHEASENKSADSRTVRVNVTVFCTTQLYSITTQVRFSTEQILLWNIVKALHHLSRQESFLLALFRKFRDETSQECEMLSMFINRMSSFMSTLTSNPRISGSSYFGLTSNMLRKLKSDRDVFLLNHFVNSVSRASHSKRGSKSSSSGEDDESDHGEIFHVALLALGTDTFLELASHLCRLNRKTDEERRRLSTEIVGKDNMSTNTRPRRNTSPTRRDPRKREMRSILNHIWKAWTQTIFQVITVLKTSDDINRILKVFERYIDTCAALLHTESLLGSLNALSKVSFPSSDEKLNRKHVLCCKSLLNIVTSDAEDLGVEGWSLCVSALSKLDEYVGHYLVLESPSEKAEALRSEYALLNTTLKGIFEITSREMSNKALNELIRGLVRVVVRDSSSCTVDDESSSNNNNDEKKVKTRRDMMKDRFRQQAMLALGVTKEKDQPGERRKKRNTRMFPLRSLVTTLLANDMERWPKWDQDIGPAFESCSHKSICVVSLGNVFKFVSDNEHLIESVLESMTKCALSVRGYFTYSEYSLVSLTTTHNSLILVTFSYFPLVILPGDSFKNQYSNTNDRTQVQLLDTILESLQERGDTITTRRGWTCVLSILSAGASCSDEKCIGLSFKSVEILVSEFLPNVLSSHTKCHEIIHVLQKFVSQRNLVNVSLSAVNLFLNVADQVEDIKEVLLGLCKVATDSRPEVCVFVFSLFLRTLDHTNTHTRYEIAP